MRGYQELVDPVQAFSSKFQHQLNIFASIKARADPAIDDIKGMLQAEIFDTELEAAEGLLARKQARAAGALAGVTLERYLGNVCGTHEIQVRKKTATIADYNDALKNDSIIDLATWRQIQFLAEVRNSCVHPKAKEPPREQVEEMIEGVKKIVKLIS